MERKEAESFLRRTLQHYGQDRPHFPGPFQQVGRPLLRSVLETLSRTSEPGQEAHPGVQRSEREGQWLRSGCLRTLLTAPVAAFSSNRKNIQGTGSLLLFADIGKPEAP